MGTATRTVTHNDQDTALTGLLAWDDGFTHEHATPGAIPGVAYDALADRRSFATALAFLAEALPSTPPHLGTARWTR
jgi:hypothetical protein